MRSYHFQTWSQTHANQTIVCIHYHTMMTAEMQWKKKHLIEKHLCLNQDPCFSEINNQLKQWSNHSSCIQGRDALLSTQFFKSLLTSWITMIYSNSAYLKNLNLISSCYHNNCIFIGDEIWQISDSAFYCYVLIFHSTTLFVFRSLRCLLKCCR